MAENEDGSRCNEADARFAYEPPALTWLGPLGRRTDGNPGVAGDIVPFAGS